MSQVNFAKLCGVIQHAEELHKTLHAEMVRTWDK